MTHHQQFTIRIWDLPTRIFHWTLAAAVTGLIISANIGGNAMVWHFRLGYLVFALLLFRFFWGFVGGHWSRWSQLPLRPQNVVAYLRGHSSTSHRAGHNPLGSWSVVTLLVFLLLQVSTGLFSDDEIANMGPFASSVSGFWVSWSTFWHKQVGKLILIALVVLHMLAIAWYSWRKRQALISAMWHGDKVSSESLTPSADGRGKRWMALFCWLVSCLIVLVVLSWGS
jgi:cytochrome b